MRLDPPDSLATERLLLRPWCEGDLAAFREALAESLDDLRRWVPWAQVPSLGSGETAALVRKWANDFAAGSAFVYATFRRADDRLVGGVGLYPRVGPGAIEIGYWIRSTDAGVGFATEASCALTSAGLALPGIERVEMHCDRRNTASRRVPEKLGYALCEDPVAGLAVYTRHATASEEGQ